MSTFKSIAETIQEIEFWLRLASFLHQPLKNALLSVLHNTSNDPQYVGLPDDSANLYTELKTNHQQKINKLLKKRILQQDQVDLLLPPNNNKTYSDTFDVTLIVVLIRNCTTLPAPLNGWSDKNPPLHDVSMAANCIRAREWRNFIHHTDPVEIDQILFHQKWNEGTQIIHALGYKYDTNQLRTISLDPKHELVLKSLFTFMGKLKQQQQQHHDLIGHIQTTVGVHAETQDDIYQQLEMVAKEVKHLQCLKTSNSDADSKSNLNNYCLEDVLVYVSDEIGEKWKDLVRMFSISSNVINAKKTDENDDSQSMLQFFESIKFLVPWNQLKQYLEILDRNDMVEHIQRHTLITRGLKNASTKLRKQYICELIDCLVEQPLATSDKTNQYIPREEEYIELAVLTAQEVDSAWTNSDRESLMKQQYLQMSSIDYKHIHEKEDECVIVRGVAGIGKSTLIEMYTLKWAKGEFLNQKEKIPQVDFLFTFTCRELNTFDCVTSLEQLLKLKYADILKCITIEDLQPIANRVMIIVDGLDELENIYSVGKITDLTKSKSQIHLRHVLDLINSKEKFLKGHRSIACGRPKACETVKLQLMRTHKIKTIEVCGFNSKSVTSYIEHFFRDEKEKVSNVQRHIEESDNLKVMASVPVFLWVICNAYSENLITEQINTNTELYIYGCLIFLRNHLRGTTTCSSQHLIDLIKDPNIAEVLFSLARLSVKTYMNHQVVFTEDEIKLLKCPFHLEQTGFIVKHSRGVLGKATYQFRHLAFQEFLCGLYLCLTKNLRPFKTNRELTSCTPTILGIDRILKEGKNVLFTELFSRLIKVCKRRDNKSFANVASFVRNRSYKAYISNVSVSSEESLNSLSLKNLLELFQNNILEINSSPDCVKYMADLFESKHSLIQARKSLPTDFEVNVKGLYSIVDTRNAVNFLDALGIKHVTYLRLWFPGDLTSHILKLIELTSNGQKLNIHLVFESSNSSRVICDQQRLTINISHVSEMSALPKALKLLSNTFIVRGPLDGKMSDNDKNIFCDLVNHVLKHRLTKQMHVFDGPGTHDIDRIPVADPNTQLSELLEEKEISDDCIVVKQDSKSILTGSDALWLYGFL